MPSKYPSVTASARGGAKAVRPLPANFPKGTPLPANDNKIGKLDLGKLPKQYRGRLSGRGRLLAIPAVIDLLNRLDDASDDWWDDVWRPDPEGVVSSPPVSMPSAYWRLDVTCPNTGDSWLDGTRPGNATFEGDIFCDGWAGLWGDGPVPYTGNETSAPYIVKAYDGVYHPSLPGFRRVKPWEKYAREAGAPVPTPLEEPGFSTVVWPAPVPLSAPLAWPIARVVSNSPWEAPEPGDEPSAEPDAKPNTSRPSKPSWEWPVWTTPVVPFPLVRVPPLRQLPGQPVMPGTVIQPGPGGRPVVNRTTGSGRPRPPGDRREKEHKIRARTAVGLVWAGINTVTEAMDFVVAMHASIKDPRYKLSEKASKRQVLNYMLTSFEPWGHIDPAEGFENFVNMQISDWASALGSKAIKRVNQDIGSLTGLDRAIREHGDAINERAEPGQRFDWVPELDIDVESGVISVSGPLGVLKVRL